MENEAYFLIRRRNVLEDRVTILRVSNRDLEIFVGAKKDLEQFGITLDLRETIGTEYPSLYEIIPVSKKEALRLEESFVTIQRQSYKHRDGHGLGVLGGV